MKTPIKAILLRTSAVLVALFVFLLIAAGTLYVYSNNVASELRRQAEAARAAAEGAKKIDQAIYK